MNDPQAPLPELIRKLRRSRQWTQHKLAGAISASKSLIQAFESGKLIPREGSAARLDEVFGTGTEIQEAATAARDDRRPWLRSWIDHERAARTLRTWEPALIPGLLQCESYMRAVFTTTPDDAGRVDELTAERDGRRPTFGWRHVGCSLRGSRFQGAPGSGTSG